MFVCFFICLFARLLACLFVCLFVCLLACLLFYLFVCSLACLFACLFVCLFVCLVAVSNSSLPKRVPWPEEIMLFVTSPEQQFTPAVAAGAPNEQILLLVWDHRFHVTSVLFVRFKGIFLNAKKNVSVRMR